MEDQNLGRGQPDALDCSLMSLYRQQQPEGFETRWRAAVRREENIQMMERRKSSSRLWKIALPSAAALVLVVGALVTGSLDPVNPILNRTYTNQTASDESALRVEGKALPAPAAMPDMGNIDLYAMDEAPMAQADAGYGGYDMKEPMEALSDAEPQAAPEARQERKIVRTASLSLATTAFEQDEQALRAKVAEMGGYVENFSQYGDGTVENPRSLTMTLRIPTERLDEFLAGTAEIGRVTAKGENATDMTVQYSDMSLRLETQRGKMERLQALLGRAADVEDLLQIESEIANTQFQIDAMETGLRDIDRQVDQSAVRVTLNEETPAQSASAAGMGLGDRVGSALRASISAIGRFFENMLVFVVLAAPWAAGIAVLGVLAWLGMRCRWRSRRNRDKTAI